MGVVGQKHYLKLSLLNVDGLSPSTFEDVKLTILRKKPDVCVLLETKRRHEEIGCDISIDGYSLHEVRRSDAADDRGGGGIAYYTRLSDGLVFHEHKPCIVDPTLHYVQNERFWLTTESVTTKTALCGLYLGCQYMDDRHGLWNEGLYATIQAEAATFRSKGYRLIFIGDFNSHIGSSFDVGIPGNHDDINKNGERFLRFLRTNSLVHVNGACRVPGQWDTKLTSGLWTRQRGHSRSVLDYVVVSSEHISTVDNLFIDDNGEYSGGSDHNWLFLTMNDKFIRKHRILNLPARKKRWNNLDNVDWQPFKATVTDLLQSKSHEDMTIDQLASTISSALLSAGTSCIGFKSNNRLRQPKLLPRDLVEELVAKRNLEKDWKSLASSALPVIEDVDLAWSKFLDQKLRVNALLFAHNNQNRPKIRKMCSGNTPEAKKNFWNRVTRKVKQSSVISAVVDPESGALKCGIDEIKQETELHLSRVFQGSFDPIAESRPALPELDSVPAFFHDHTYGVKSAPTLPSIDNSCEIDNDPAGWMNKKFLVSEVTKIVKKLKCGKSAGWDAIPNNFLINSPDLLFHWLTVLFNRIKSKGIMPKGWNKGRITLIHKSGLREHLFNYRPITVIISLSGVFSKLLNSRLSEVVESHKLLGEEQNGFRKERGMADNSFILDSILWKAKSTKQKIHLCYVDISKAYDSVNRSILWSRLASMGFKGEFLQSLQALYTGDSVDSVVNGLSTRQVYLGRGLRQGCSLSPLLFALYISQIGCDLTSSSVGFDIGGLTISGLLFADDIVLISCSIDGLENLVNIVKCHCDTLKLEISIKKSKIVTPDNINELELFGDNGEVTLSLSKVLSYKYLGTDTTLLMSSTGSKRQQRCILTAKKYKFACFYVARTGPDVLDTVLATWSNIALPSILSGCDVIPFTETTIDSIERLQSQLAKHALGLNQSTANVCAQTELGLKPFRMLLYLHQLKFYVRVMALPQTRWVRRVLYDHLMGNWFSPYIAYITRIRLKLGLLQLVPTTRNLEIHLDAWFLNNTNSLVATLDLPCVPRVEKFTRLRYVYEHDGCSSIAEFKFQNAGLGNRAPRPGRRRTNKCALCSGDLDEFHVSFICTAMEGFRKLNTDVTIFRNVCQVNNIQPRMAFKKYINGLEWNNIAVDTTQYARRGIMLSLIKKEWLRCTKHYVP